MSEGHINNAYCNILFMPVCIYILCHIKQFQGVVAISSWGRTDSMEDFKQYDVHNGTPVSRLGIIMGVPGGAYLSPPA